MACITFGGVFVGLLHETAGLCVVENRISEAAGYFAPMVFKEVGCTFLYNRLEKLIFRHSNKPVAKLILNQAEDFYLVN